MGTNNTDGIIYRKVDTDTENPAIEIVGIIAELENKRMDELRAIWDILDGVIEHIFSTPPLAEAQVEVTFSYEGYRITVHQDGNVKFVKTGQTS